MVDLRSKALALLSALASGALLGAFPMLAVQSWRGQWPPLEQKDVIAGLLFVGLALVTVSVVLRAIFRRERKGFFDTSRLKDGPEAHGVEHLVGQTELVGLARACGGAVAVGIAAGLWAGWQIHQTRLEGVLSDAESWCEAWSSVGFADSTACEDTGRRCIREGWSLPEARLARVPALQQALWERLKASLERQPRDALTEDRSASQWGRLVNDLKDSADSPLSARSRQAALVCLIEASGVPF
jgi:hypothetical protein